MYCVSGEDPQWSRTHTLECDLVRKYSVLSAHATLGGCVAGEKVALPKREALGRRGIAEVKIQQTAPILIFLSSDYLVTLIDIFGLADKQYFPIRNDASIGIYCAYLLWRQQTRVIPKLEMHLRIYFEQSFRFGVRHAPELFLELHHALPNRFCFYFDAFSLINTIVNSVLERLICLFSTLHTQTKLRRCPPPYANPLSIATNEPLNMFP